MVEPERHDEAIIAFVIVRLWWDQGASPRLRARVRGSLDERSGEVLEQVAAGRTQILETVAGMLNNFERVAGLRTSGR
jgi:hypothetical protein